MDFNSHAHVERDHFSWCKNCKYFHFNSHAHVERDDILLDFAYCISQNFNSHAHVERDYSGFATGTNYQDFNSHAHVERDRFYAWTVLMWTYFNSHAHVERDSRYYFNRSILGISTHTLTWSVTQRRRNTCHGCQNFNSHAHVERDVCTAPFW